MYSVRFDSKNAKKVLDNIVKYSDGFIRETKAKESTITKNLADTSISAFYDYLDGIARTNPSMLHHIYEWGQIGDPNARLVELKKRLSKTTAQINAEFILSESIPDGSTEPFYAKAEIMENGIPVTVQATEAQAMFFEVDGEEFFRVGPIEIENPGGEQVRGAFLETFEEFYNTYFERVYLEAIRFYDHFRSPQGFARNFKSGVVSSNATNAGRTTALKWIMTMPGDKYE